LIYVIVSAPGQPRNIKAKVLSPKRIEVSWLPPTDSANIRSYNVYFSNSSENQKLQRVIEHPNSYVLEDLIPDTVYHFQVSATTNGGEGEKSPIIEVKTSPLGKCKQYVGGVVKYPFCKQTELVV
jgi:fibronectin type 3 domain-containing protein